MKRSRSAVLIVASLLLVPGIARAEDAELKIARILCEHQAYAAAEEYATALVEQGKSEALAFKAWALAGRATKENNPKLLDQAKKALADAKTKGSKIQIDLEHLPGPKFGSPDDEIQCAWSLKSRGKIGAAEAVIEAAIAGAGLPPRELAHAKIVRADLLGDRARMAELGNSDAAKRKEFFEKAKALFLEVADAQGMPPEVTVEARCSYYELCYMRGRGLDESSKRADDLSQQEALKKEALEAFKAGAELLDAECKRLREALDKANAPAPAEPGKEPKEGDQPAQQHAKPEEICLMYANYFWPKCLVGQAKCVSDKAEHDSIINKATEIYSNYNLDFGDKSLGKEAAIDMAEAYREIGNEELAVVALESALSIEQDSPDFDRLHGTDPKKPLRIGYVDNNGKFVPDPQSFDIFARASLVKGKSLKAKRDWKKALAAFDKVFADAKVTGIDYEKDPLGKALIIERAEALARDGKIKDAQADLNRLIKEDESGPTGQSARAMLAKLSTGGGGGAQADDALAGVNAERALQLMDDALGKGELNQVTSFARLALRKGKEEARTDVAPRALFALGKAYEELGRHYEAAIAFEEITSRYSDAKNAGSAAGEIVACYNYLRIRAFSNHDKQKYDDALRLLTSKYPSEGEGMGDYLLAQECQEQQKFDEAAKYYEKVSTKAGDKYDKSLFYACQCRYLLAQQLLKDKRDAKQVYLDTAAGLRKAIQVFGTSDASISDDRRKLRKDFDAMARFLLADVLIKDEVNKPEEVLTLFEHAATDYEGNPENLSRAGNLRIHADLKMKRLDAAESELKMLLEKYPGLKRTILAAKDVGRELDVDLDAKRKTISPEDRRKIRTRIAHYYARWILDGLKSQDAVPKLVDVRATAIRLSEFGLDVCGQPEDGGFIQEVDLDKFDAGEAKQIFADARDVYANLVEPENMKQLKDGWAMSAYYGEAAGFIKDWASCQKGLEGAIEQTKFLANGQIDLGVAAKNKTLLAYYFDLGCCYEQLGQSDKANYQKALDVFTNVVNAASDGSRTWWGAKHEALRVLFRRGSDQDYKELATALHALERKYPDFKEAGKHPGMQEKFQKLKADCDAKGIK